MSFLGYIIEQGNLKADPAKVDAVLNWPVPVNCKQLQSFQGFANFYRRFIRDYSKIAAPLTHLTTPKVPFLWDRPAQEAFTQLKKCFASAPILSQPDLNQQFIVKVDASDSGVEAVLAVKVNSTPVHFSPAVSPQQNTTMTSGTVSCWPSSWPWRSGSTG